MKVVWSDQALSRLVEIREFVAQDSPTATLDPQVAGLLCVEE